MKKLLLTFVACLVAIAANATTVYFENTGKWSKVSAYCWSPENAGWPGVACTTTITASGTDYYAYTIPGNQTQIIFNNGSDSGKTKDLAVIDGAVYSFAVNYNNGGTTDPIGTIKKEDDGSYTFTKAGEVVLTEGKLYFPVETYNESKAYFYSWSPDVTGAWPGTQLTKETVNGIEFWVFTTKDDREITDKTLGGAQLNTGDNTKEVQVTNVKVNPGYYINIKTGASGPVAEYVSSGGNDPNPNPGTDMSNWYFNFSGAFNDWGSDNGVQPGSATTVSWTGLNIGSGEFEIKVYDGSKDIFYGGAMNMAVDTPTVLTLGGGHCSVKGASSDAVFSATYNINTHELTLTLTSGTIEDGGDTPVDPTPEVTLYIVGGSINGSEVWSASDNTKMTYDETAGTYTWTGESLGSGFKFNNGEWDKGYNIGAQNEDNSLTIDTPFTVVNDQNSKNINFAYSEITNPVVTLDLKNLKVTVTGDAGEIVEPTIPSKIYLRGAFNGWGGTEMALESEEPNTNGEYVYIVKDLETLGGDFKVCENNDADWTGLNFGAGDEASFTFAEGETSKTLPSYSKGGNFSCSNLTNVTVTFLYNPNGQSYMMLSIPEGEVVDPTPGEVPTVLYFKGTINEWEGEAMNLVVNEDDKPEMTENDEYKYVIVLSNLSGYFKVAQSMGAETWTGLQFGAGTDTTFDLSSDDTQDQTLEAFTGDGTSDFSISSAIENVVVTLFYNPNGRNWLRISKDLAEGVDSIVAEDGEAVYYNLQGQKVANPDKGIFIKVQNGKAVKIAK